MRRLYDRQTALIQHLTAARTIFGEDQPLDPRLDGIDSGRLRLEAWSSFAKRVGKIEAALPRTLALLGERRDAMLCGFAAAFPPTGIGRHENARLFHEFLCETWRQTPPEPPYLADVARLELALAGVRGFCRETTTDREDDPAPAGGGLAVRRPPGMALVRCDHDVRALFDDEAEPPPARPVHLAVRRRQYDREPGVFEIPDWLFAELEGLERWTPWTDVAMAVRPDAAVLLADLIDRALLEASQ